MKNIILYIVIAQGAVILGSLLLHQEMTLLDYINSSFYLSSFLLFISLLIYTINSGFFDNISRSFRLFFAPKGSYSEAEKKEMTPLSQLINARYTPLLFAGLGTLVLMCLALLVYYL